MKALLDFIAWLREEWRLARAESWADGVYRGTAGTTKDPDVALMVVKQRAMGKRMRRQGRSLLSGKAYVPALTKFAEPASPHQQPHNVVPLRKATTR